jgi:hypothetical protein
MRLYVGAVGIHRVFVNGVDILVEDRPTGDLPGAVLRPGQRRGPATP